MNRLALLLIIFAGCSSEPVELPTAEPATGKTFFERAQDRIDEGDIDGAIDNLTKAIDRRPEYADAFALRGNLLSGQKKYSEAIADMERAILLAPTYFAPLNDLAWILATCPNDKFRDGKRAISLANLAVFHGGSKWEFNDTMAAALAECGEFSEAIRALTIAIESAPADRKEELQMHMLSYQQGKPWRD
jgi:tetratricopeptide (TPR) repeat protein